MTTKHDFSASRPRRTRRIVAAVVACCIAICSAATAAAQYHLGAVGYDAYWQGEVGKIFTMPWETRVGIGTADPQAALHVNSQDDARLGAHDTGGVMIGRTSHSHLNLVLDGNEIMARKGTEAGPLYLNAGGGKVIIHSSEPQDRRVTVEEDGRVRIGASNDQHPDAKLSVDGSVVAEEVIVTLDGFPDYVFADDYDLTSLADVERHIEEHGHLPHMPSAAEVEGSGADLGDLHKRLLRTVEELTLHTIAQSKRIEAQRRSQQRLERRLAELTATEGDAGGGE